MTNDRPPSATLDALFQYYMLTNLAFEAVRNPRNPGDRRTQSPTAGWQPRSYIHLVQV
jgi:hypothetical protein